MADIFEKDEFLVSDRTTFDTTSGQTIQAVVDTSGKDDNLVDKIVHIFETGNNIFEKGFDFLDSIGIVEPKDSEQVRQDLDSVTSGFVDSFFQSDTKDKIFGAIRKEMLPIAVVVGAIVAALLLKGAGKK